MKGGGKMSWKMFWQVVLLIVIAGLLASVFKMGLLQCKYGRGGKYLKDHPRMEKSLRK